MKTILNKTNKYFYMQMILFLIASLFLISSYKKSQESEMPTLLPVPLVGEYCQDGGEWKPYEEGVSISALEGDVVFRGNFGMNLSGVKEYQFYLDHVELTVYKNGQKMFQSKPDFPLTQETLCVKTWSTWYCEPVTSEDVLEFHLHNPHNAGNVDAFENFFESIYGCPEILLQGSIQMMNRTVKAIGLVIVTIAIILLGIGAGLGFVDDELGKVFWPFGLLTLFMGGYFIFDLKMDAINYFKDILASNLHRCCIMFAAYEITLIAQREINRHSEKKLPPIVLGLSVFDGLLLLLSLMGNVSFYDTLPIWHLIQGAFFCVLIIMGLKTFIAIPEKKWNMLFSSIILMISVVLEFVNSYFNLWAQGELWKAVFIVCLGHFLIVGISTVPKSYRASKETERLKRELSNSRVVLAMSQIRTHFIFNVLNAISGMCLYDPQEANRTVVHFAKYLRGNINVLQNDELISFKKELEHLEDYIVLEKVRFEDKIRFEKEIETEEFLVPPMILQPIVENSIKHGLLRRKEGGSILLKVKRKGKQVIIQIVDDGLGFNVNEPAREGAVGVSNVKFRLEHMIDGKMEMESIPDQGTTVTITVPYMTV